MNNHIGRYLYSTTVYLSVIYFIPLKFYLLLAALSSLPQRRLSMTTHSRIADLPLQLSRRLPMARRHTENTVRHTIVALALAVALSGAAANVAAARGGGGGGHGG